MEDAYNGVNFPIEIDRWIMVGNEKKNEKEKNLCKYSKGTDNGNQIVRDKGHIINDTLKGDVKVFIKINDNGSELKRQGLNLLCEKKISLKKHYVDFYLKLNI